MDRRNEVFEFMKYEALIFDLDGTMWDATDNILFSWGVAIKKVPGCEDLEVSEEALHSVFGMPMDQIAAKLFPSLSLEKQQEILEACCIEENEYLEAHGGNLYPMLEKTLETLKKDHKLYIVSNGQAGYIQSFLKSHNMSKYFDDIQNWGDNKVPKGENIKVVMERNNVKTAAYVGDTKGDADAAKQAGIDFIFARYGFGDVQEYTYVIDTFSELLSLDL